MHDRLVSRPQCFLVLFLLYILNQKTCFTEMPFKNVWTAQQAHDVYNVGLTLMHEV